MLLGFRFYRNNIVHLFLLSSQPIFWQAFVFLQSSPTRKSINVFFFLTFMGSRREVMNLMFPMLEELIRKLKMNVWESEFILFYLCLGNNNWAVWHYNFFMCNDTYCKYWASWFQVCHSLLASGRCSCIASRALICWSARGHLVLMSSHFASCNSSPSFWISSCSAIFKNSFSLLLRTVAIKIALKKIN